jgi:hypothetical protein
MRQGIDAAAAGRGRTLQDLASTRSRLASQGKSIARRTRTARFDEFLIRPAHLSDWTATIHGGRA